MAAPGSHLAIPAPNVGGSATASLRQIAITPDGRTVLFSGIWGSDNRPIRRDLDDVRSRELSQTIPFIGNYVFSSDGREFLAIGVDDGFLYRYSAEGGNERIVMQNPPASNWFDWADDGSIWFSSDGDRGLVRVDLSGGAKRMFGERFMGHTLQQIIPGTSTALMVRSRRGVSSGPLVAVDLESGESTILLDTNISGGLYTAGYLLVVLPDGVLQAAPFDLSAVRVDGPFVPLAEGILVDQGVNQISVSRNGSVAYMPQESRDLVLLDRSGSVRRIPHPGGNFHAPSFAADGRRLAVDYNTADGRNVWVVDIEEGVASRATFVPNGHDARWNPDGVTLTYLADTEGTAQFGIFQSRPGSVEADSLIASRSISYSGEWLSDGSALVTTADGFGDQTGQDLVIIRDGGTGAPEPLVVTRFEEAWPAVSPDDRWLAYASDRSGRNEVYVGPLDGDGPEIQVSQSGGVEPLWNPNGAELFYRGGPGAGTEMIAARIGTETELRVTGRQTLFSVADMATGIPHTNYDVSPDGSTFVMVRFNPSSRIMVIQNLPDIMERRLGIRR